MDAVATWKNKVISSIAAIGLVLLGGFWFLPQEAVARSMEIVQVAGGGYHSVALRSDGSVVVWGSNDLGQGMVPTGLVNVVQVAAGANHTLALKADGTVVAWGDNGYLQATLPNGLSSVAQIAAGDFHSVALRSDGTVIAWGEDADGQPSVQASVPNGLSGVKQVAAGANHTLALKSDGTVVAWGVNDYGQSSVPVGLGNVVQVAAGASHSVALKSDGTVVAWGDGYFNQTVVPQGLSGVVQIASGAFHVLALKGDGSLAVWGGLGYGEGDLPVELGDGIQVAAGGYHSLVLKSDGSVLSWGYGDFGQTAVPLKLGVMVQLSGGGKHTLATQVDGTVAGWGDNLFGQLDFPADLVSVAEVAAGHLHSLALKNDGSVLGWGDNSAGQVMVPGGLGTVVQVAAGYNHSVALDSNGTVTVWGDGSKGQTSIPAGVSDIVQIASGDNHIVALKNDGNVIAWGDNSKGQATVPPNLGRVLQVAAGSTHSVVLKADGTVSVWGSNALGQTAVPAGLNRVIQIVAGTHHTLALQADGTVVAWGWGALGQTAVPIGLANVVQIAAGAYHSLALLSDGSLVSWGDNGNGQSLSLQQVQPGHKALASGFAHSLALRASGVVVSTGLNDLGQTSVPEGLVAVKAVAAGQKHSVAVKADGTVVAWGENLGGAARPEGLTGVVRAAVGTAHVLALKGDGSVVTWGDNSFGQSTPPAGLANVVRIAAGSHHSLALVSNGAVVAWGRNQAGQTTVPVLAQSGVIDIAAGADFSVALKANGSVVVWGDNAAGQRTVPAAANNVLAIAAGAQHVLALKGNGAVVAWGQNSAGQTTVPVGIGNVVTLAAGAFHSLALAANGTLVGWGGNGDNQRVFPTEPTWTVTPATAIGGVLLPNMPQTIVTSYPLLTRGAPDYLYLASGISGCDATRFGDLYFLFGTTDCTLVPLFDAYAYLVAAEAGTGGAITPSVQPVDVGVAGVFIVTPATGYHVKDVTGCGGFLDGNVYTTAMITEPCTVSAMFEQNIYAVDVIRSGNGNGSVISDPAGILCGAICSELFTHGEVVTLSVTPDDGHRLVSASGCNGTLNEMSYSTAPLTAPCTVNLTFDLLQAASPPNIVVPARDADGSYAVTWGVSNTGGATYILQEATDALFTAGVRIAYQGSARSVVISGRSLGMNYYYRVKASKAGFADSDWRTAPALCAVGNAGTPSILTVPVNDADGTYSLAWTPSVTPDAVYIVQEASNSTFTTGVREVYRGIDTSVEVTVTSTSLSAYFYRVRSTRSGFPDSPWRSGINSCKTGVPAPPGTPMVPLGDADGVYTVTWVASESLGITYTLQEATDQLFTTGVRTAYSGTGLTANISGRSKGVNYYYRVRAGKYGYLSSDWLTAANPCSIGKLSTPTILSVPTSDEDGDFTIAWGGSASPNVTYFVEEATNSGFTAGLSIAYIGFDTKADLVGRTPGLTYYYRVRATKTGFPDSPWRVTGNGCNIGTPQPPATLTVPPQDPDGGYTVTWSASLTPGVSYVLEEATDAAFSNGVRNAYMGTARSVAIAGRAVGLAYYYRVSASKTGFPQSLATVATNPCRVGKAAAPATLITPANDGDGNYVVSWSKSITPDASYVLEEAANTLFTVGKREVYRGSELSAMIVVAPAGLPVYYYRVKTISNGFPDSVWKGNSISCKVGVPEPPAGITVPTIDPDGNYSVSWLPSTSTGVKYVLEEARDAAFENSLRTVYNGTLLVAAVTLRSKGEAYFYRVRTTKTGYVSSDWVQANTACNVGAPYASTAVTVPAIDDDGAFTVTWNASISTDVEYVLEEASNTTFTAELREVYRGNSTSVAISGRSAGVIYYYRVKVSKVGFPDSAWKGAANGCKVGMLVSPANLVVPVNDADGAYEIFWDASPTPGVTYTLQEATNAAFTAGVRTVPGTETQPVAVITERTPGTYYYRVRANKSGFTSTSWVITTNGCLVQ